MWQWYYPPRTFTAYSPADTFGNHGNRGGTGHSSLEMLYSNSMHSSYCGRGPMRSPPRGGRQNNGRRASSHFTRASKRGMKFNCLERPLSNFFYGYAKLVSRCPGPFIILPLLLTALLGVGFKFPFQVLEDNVDLYTPSDGKAKTERRNLETLFPVDDSSPYFVDRRYDQRRSGFVIVTAAPKYDPNVFAPAIFDEILTLWHRIEGQYVFHNQSLFNYSSLCVTVVVQGDTSTCVQNPLLQAFGQDAKMLKTLVYPTTAYGWFIGNFLGSPILNPNHTVKSVKALLLPYQLRHSLPEDDERATLWERRLSVYLSTYASPHIQISWFTSQTLSDESQRDTVKLKLLTGPLFVIVTGFTILSCFVRSWIRSKPWLGLAGILSAACAIISAVGVMMCGQMKFCSVAYFMPFIVFSIGVDNVFILLASWRKTDTTLSVTERMALSFKDAGVSITVTTLTDILSFGVGCTSTFPSVRIFCISAAIAIGFVYLYQLTLFAGFMVLTGRRESRKQHCLTFRRIDPDRSKRASIDSKYSIYAAATETLKPPTSSVGDESIKDVALSLFFRDGFTNFLMQPAVKTAVVFLFFAYVGISAWGCTQMEVGFNPKELVPTDSYAKQSLELYEKHFSAYGGWLHLWITNLTNQETTTKRFWDRINREVELFENTEFSDYADSWLRVFYVFGRAQGLQLTSENFAAVLRNVLLAQPPYDKYKMDILFVDAGAHISAVRFPIRLRNCGFSNHSRAVTFFRNLAATSKLNISVYNEFFDLADQYDALLPSTLLNIAQAGAAVVAVSLLLIPKPLCAIWVSITIASINVGILGLMTLWSVNLDFISMTTIIMNIGFCVDFSAHIAYHFSKESGALTVDRVRSALHAVGTPIVQSALSTILGIVILLYVDNYVYRSFVKTVALVVLLGTLHGLVVLPVLLTLVHCERDERRNSASERQIHRSPFIFPIFRPCNVIGLPPSHFLPAQLQPQQLLGLPSSKPNGPWPLAIQQQQQHQQYCYDDRTIDLPRIAGYGGALAALSAAIGGDRALENTYSIPRHAHHPQQGHQKLPSRHRPALPPPEVWSIGGSGQVAPAPPPIPANWSFGAADGYSRASGRNVRTHGAAVNRSCSETVKSGGGETMRSLGPVWDEPGWWNGATPLPTLVEGSHEGRSDSTLTHPTTSESRLRSTTASNASPKEILSLKL